MLVCAVQNFDKAGIRRRVLASSCYPAFFRGHQRVGTPEYLSMMRLRKIWAEGSFSVLKREHCISKIRKRGILAATEECLLAAMALNLKRMVNAIFRYYAFTIKSCVKVCCFGSWGGKADTGTAFDTERPALQRYDGT